MSARRRRLLVAAVLATAATWYATVAFCPPYVPPYEPPYPLPGICGCWEEEAAGAVVETEQDVLRAAFTFTLSGEEAPLGAEFRDASIGGIVEWYWDFGNGCSSAERNPVTEYRSFGRYRVTLTVRDATGTESEVSDYVEVLRRDRNGWRDIPFPSTLVYAANSLPESLDPVAQVRSPDATLVLNLYESLFEWPAGNVDAGERDLGYSLDTRDCLPMLGMAIPKFDNGLIVELPDGRVQYTIPIRWGVLFHNGGELTAEDVEYSFERAVLLGTVSGSASALIEALSGGTYSGLCELVEDVLGIDTCRGQGIPELTEWAQSKVYEAIDPWIEVDGDSIVFTLDAPYAPFLSMLVHGSAGASVLDKEWCAERGSWDGEPGTWAAHIAGVASDSPLWNSANGTGAFKLESLQPDQRASLVRFDGYWRELARLERVEIVLAAEEAVRCDALERGDADIADIVTADSLARAEGMDGVIAHFHLPRLVMSPVVFFNTEISMGDNALVGSGGLAEDGIPFDFFADAHVRKGFAYAFDASAYIGELTRASGGRCETIGPIPKAFRWAYEERLHPRRFDLDKAEEHLRLAYDGMLWDVGFTMTLPCVEGVFDRELLCSIWQNTLESLNPRFHINMRCIPHSEYVNLRWDGKLPLFRSGWLADYADPHSFVGAFASSGSAFAWYFSLGAPIHAVLEEEYDVLISAAQAATDLAKRASIYRTIQGMLNEDCFYVWLPQASGYRVMRDWVRGWRFHPGLPGPHFYTMYKGYE